jgi:DNA-binding MarR family transcriptional regulator
MSSSRTLPDKQSIQQMASCYPEIDIPSVEACLVFLETSTAFYNFVDSYLAPYKLSRGGFTILAQLVAASENRLLPSEFAERAGVTRASVTSLLDRLERDKLIKRQSHPTDRRMLTVRLTDEGRELIDKVLPLHFSYINVWMSDLSANEKQLLIKLLTKLRLKIPKSQKL